MVVSKASSHQAFSAADVR